MKNYNWGIRSRIWIVLTCLFVVSLTFILLPEAYGATEEFLATSRTYGTDGRSYVEKDDNGNYVIHVYGSSYNMGYQHGYLLSTEAETNIQNILDYSASSITKAALVAYWDAMYAAGYIPEKYKEEIEGIIDGIGLETTVADAHAATVFFDYDFYTCSSFVVFGSANSTSNLYHGRNLDGFKDILLHNYPLIMICHPDDGQIFANVTWAGVITMHTGININKISFSLDNLDQNAAVNKTMLGTPFSLLARKAVEEGRSLTEVVSILEDADRTVGMMYILADGNNLTTKVLETDEASYSSYGPGDPNVTGGADLSIRTNFAFDTASFGEITPDGGGKDAVARYDLLADNIQDDYGTIDLEKVIAFLADSPVGNSTTIQSTVFMTDTLDFWVANAEGDSPAHSRTYYHYNDLSELINGGIDHHHSWYECALATAAYGDYTDRHGFITDSHRSQIATLCKFRDECLLTNPLGRASVRFYYCHSSRVADFIRDKELLKATVRVGLKPIVWLAKKIIN